jgi:hypothetical protein
MMVGKSVLHIVGIVAAGALMIAGYVYLFKSMNETFDMQQEINDKLPADRQFEPTSWTLGTWQHFRRLQKELLPDSTRPVRFRKFSIAAAVLWFSGMFALVFVLKH